MSIVVKKLQETVLKYEKDLNNRVTMEQSLQRIEELIASMKGLLDDGFQWKDVANAIGMVVPGLMKIAEDLEDKTGEEKKAFVVDAVWVIYKTVDPNIPWIPEPFETQIEFTIVNEVTSGAVEAVYLFGKKLGYWSN